MKSRTKQSRRGVVWKKQRFTKAFGRKRVVFAPLKRAQIGRVIAFLKGTFPALEGSFQHDYLKRSFYRTRCALSDSWSSHARTRRILIYIATRVGTEEIVGVASVLRESDMPTIVSGIGAVHEAWRESGLFEWMVTGLDQVCRASRVEHVVCIATVDNRAAQRVYLKRGCRVCAIVPGEDRRIDARGRVTFVPDIYFYRYFGRAGKNQMPERLWELHPKVATLWKTLKRLR